MIKKLKPCRFCGGKVKVQKHYGFTNYGCVKYYSVSCINGHLLIEGCFEKRKAIKAWNTLVGGNN